MDVYIHHPCTRCFGFFLRLNTQAEAINTLMDLRNKISTQEDFAEIAQEHSDCGSARSGGDLGEFGEGQMMKVWCYCTDKSTRDIDSRLRARVNCCQVWRATLHVGVQQQ